VQPDRGSGHAGQSLTEFALILPIILVIFVAVADLARVYTTILSVESAAREAADYGSFQSSNWLGDASDPTSNRAKTIEGMIQRACTAASNTPDYVPDGGTGCTNPAFEFALIDETGADVTDDPTCSDEGREPPCRVKVTLTHDFNLIIPLRISLRDVEFGFPAELTIVRDSVFAMSDLEIPGAPATATPTATP
jgi:Flp pilus assembly protein TadG